MDFLVILRVCLTPQSFSDMKKRANKAPEPTPGLVTPRAFECDPEMKRRNGNRDAARGAPSPVVAHL